MNGLNLVEKLDTYSKNKNLNGYKCTFIGNSSVGKTSIIIRAIKDTFSIFNEATIGAAFSIITKKICAHPEITIKLEIWDTAGQERFASLVTMYLRNSHVVLLVYDLSNPNSFKDIKEKWIPYIQKEANYKTDALIYLIANKYDLNQKDDLILPGITLANEIKAKFFVTSAKENIGIKDLFTDICNTLNNREFKQTYTIPQPILSVNDNKKINRNCWRNFLSYFYLV